MALAYGCGLAAGEVATVRTGHLRRLDCGAVVVTVPGAERLIVCRAAWEDVLARAAMSAARAAMTSMKEMHRATIFEAGNPHSIARKEFARVVDDGDLVTSAGVTSGLELALWLTQRAYGTQMSMNVEMVLEYERRGVVHEARRRWGASVRFGAKPDGLGHSLAWVRAPSSR
ncbi:hypothetical protein [Nonomuraea sp. NPDC003709]|uniref:hypothetical protein n=1 Tax=Nonomuraea sp. NPDC003709 TaxID=3154450 RepID=UPI0033A22F46